MATGSTFEYEGKPYELKMTRAGIRAAEANGLSTSNLGEKPLSSVGLLFFAALYWRYKINPNKAVNMLDDLIEQGVFNFTSLFEELSEAYFELFGLGESETEK